MIKNVLFVDDNRILCRLIQKKFDRCKDIFSIITARNGLDALDKLKEKNISLIVTALEMPNMDGFALLTHLSENYPDIPVVVQTGQGTPQARKVVLESGAVSYIEQPFKIEDLGKLILSTLERESEGGIFKTFSLEMFLQLIEMEMKTCTIRATDKMSGEQGVLFFREGDLIDARIRSRNGKQAAFEIFCWDDVTFSVQDNCARKEKRINGDLQSILFEAIRLKDEAAHNQHGRNEKTGESNLSVAEVQEGPALHNDIDVTNTFSLEDITEIQGVEGVMAISTDGKPGFSKFVSNRPSQLEDINWLSFFKILDGVREAELVFENMRFFLRKIEKGYIVVILETTVPIELIRRSCEMLYTTRKQLE